MNPFGMQSMVVLQLVGTLLLLSMLLLLPAVSTTPEKATQAKKATRGQADPLLPNVPPAKKATQGKTTQGKATQGKKKKATYRCLSNFNKKINKLIIAMHFASQ